MGAAPPRVQADGRGAREAPSTSHLHGRGEHAYHRRLRGDRSFGAKHCPKTRSPLDQPERVAKRPKPHCEQPGARATGDPVSWLLNAEEFANHEAGLDGQGGSSYIDAVICRNFDRSSVFTDASDGVLETRRYICQNWRADVIAIVASNSWQLEEDRYSSYGIPFGLPAGDTNSDGDCDAARSTKVQTWINGPRYNRLGHVELD